MARRFPVRFRDDEKFKINDVVDFEQDQMDEIIDVAASYTKKELREADSGHDLSYLTDDQKATVLEVKDEVVNGKTADELRKQKLVEVSFHSNERLLQRRGTNQLYEVINLIDKIIVANEVEKAQFKGYPALSYTTVIRNDPEYNKLPITFKWNKGTRTIKSVTVAFRNAPIQRMKGAIVTNNDTMNKMESLKQQLVEEIRKKNQGRGS